MRLKSLVTEAVAGPYGSSLTKAMYSQRGYRVYGQQQVIPDDFSVGDYYISADKFVEMTRYGVLPHDVLVSVMGTVGRVAVVPETAEPGIINPRLVRYRPDFNRVRPRYLQLAMQASPSQAQLAEGAKGTTMEGLNMQILGKLLILVPPLHEQDAICDFLDSEVVTFDIAITRTEREIALIREYRTRLVADVVTGQLDVREATAKLPEEPREEEFEPVEVGIGDEGEPSEFEDTADSGTIGQE
jgi:type I restriction enzyme S subunit